MALSTKNISAETTQKIEALLAPWRTSPQEPPFTPGQLVIMAILMCDGEASECQIHKWVLTTFSRRSVCLLRAWVDYSWSPMFYTRWEDEREELHLDYQWQNEGDDFVKEWNVLKLQRDITQALRRCELPVQQMPNDWSIDFSDRYKVEGPAGEAFLSSLFSQRDAEDFSTFNFFGLPRELRDKIYELVFAYPESGLRSPGSEDGFPVASRDWSVNFSWELWDGVDHRDPDQPNSLVTKPMGEILRPLLVNRQFYTEAMPIFYSCNHFHCGHDHWALASLAKLIAPSRRQHVSQISFELSEFCDEAGAHSALASFTGLRKLNIICNEASWGKYLKRSKLMGSRVVVILGRMRGLEDVTFYGSPTLERLLKPLMLQPKPKAADSEEGEQEQPKDGQTKGEEDGQND